MADPLVSWKPLVICGKTAGDFSEPCTFKHLVILAQNLINDLILLSTIAAVVAFIYAAFKLMTSGGNEGAMKDAKSTFFTVVKGYVWILVAWLLVYTITSVLLKPEFNFILGNP